MRAPTSTSRSRDRRRSSNGSSNASEAIPHRWRGSSRSRFTGLPCACDTGFRIDPSTRHHQGRGATLILSDTAVCADCLDHLFDPADRRYRHPFIACNDCGPRISHHRAGHITDDTDATLARVLTSLRAGRIVALKGLGGYHLAVGQVMVAADRTGRERICA